MTTRPSALLIASCFLGMAAMVYAGRPVSYHRMIMPAIGLWAAIPYLVAHLTLSSTPSSGGIAVSGILTLSIGPILIFGARGLLRIDTRYDPIFMATPLLQVALFLPLGLLARRSSKAALASASRRQTGL